MSSVSCLFGSPTTLQMTMAVEPLAVPDGRATSMPKGAVRQVASAAPNASLDIIDIRRAAVEINLKGEILQLFHAKIGPRKLPTLLLYDERGLQLFEEVGLRPDHADGSSTC